MRRNDIESESAGSPAPVPLCNRSAFELALEGEHRAAREAMKPLSIAFCDIDRIKLIYNAHGHEVGSRVIQAIARALLRISDQNCLFAYEGGSEVLVLFRGSSPDQAHQMLDQVREAFARRKLIDRETRSLIGTVTFSVHVTDVLACADPRQALKAVDEAIRQAQRQSRTEMLSASKTAHSLVQTVDSNTSARAESVERKEAVTTYFSEGLVRQLRAIAIQEDVTIHSLVGEALDLLMRSRGLKPFGQR